MHPRLREITDLISKIPAPEFPLCFQKSGKLVICLVEFRIQPEIEWVMNAVMRIYKPEEIGIAMVYGTKNAEYVEKLFQNWDNMYLIKTEHENLNRGTYSVLLKQPQFYENLLNFSHVLIYQTDALIFRKIDDIYFEYDYIGAPWKLTNQCAKFPAGNGGFSLRNVKAMIAVCERYRHTPFEKGNRGNEDIFFCSQPQLKYPEFNSETHKAFSVEREYYPLPIGCHQLHLLQMTKPQWVEFAKNNIIGNLYERIKPAPLPCIENTKKKNEENKKEVTTSEITEIRELKLQEQRIGPFLVEFIDESKNKWEIDCSVPYEILFCVNENHMTQVKSYEIASQHRAIVHKKEKGCFYYFSDNYVYVCFKGFPNGGESHGDIHAPQGNSFGRCRELPKNGIIMLKAPYLDTPVLTKHVNIYEEDELKLEVPELVYVLFSGVGYCNQLFSLETAVYLANISKRALRLYIQHPLVHCGRPNKDFGVITDYISKDFNRHLEYGFSIHPFKCVPKCRRVHLTRTLSNSVFVDPDLTNVQTSKDRGEFVHSRTELDKNILENLFDLKVKRIKIDKSNASRCFTNFYTRTENYALMGQIANDMSKQIEPIENIFQSISKKLLPRNNYLAIHLRFGDYHKNVNKIVGANQSIEDNIEPWVMKYRKILVMTDRKDNPFFAKYKNKFIFTDDLITKEHTDILSEYFKRTEVAEFLIQKKICEYSDLFIGSQGSTVSNHIQYRNYINGKEYEKFTHMTCRNYDTKSLSLLRKTNHKYSWTQKNYLRGHPMAWSMFFDDNVHRKLYFNVDTWLDMADKKIVTRNEKIDTFDGKVLMIKTDLILDYIDQLLLIKVPFVLITLSNDNHCAQYLEFPFNQEEIIDKVDMLLNNSKLIKWFCKNPCIVHSKISPLPIGPKMQWNTTQFYGEDISTMNQTFYRYFMNPEKLFYGDSKKSLVYVNFTSGTSNNAFYKPFKGIRYECRKQLTKNGFEVSQSVPQLTKNGFEQYISDLSGYKFSASPPGKGIDTHRAWESLLVGTIPIMITSPLDVMFEDLPVVIVDDYENINDEFLNKKYEELKSRENYNFEKLYRGYWIDEIKNC